MSPKTCGFQVFEVGWYGFAIGQYGPVTPGPEAIATRATSCGGRGMRHSTFAFSYRAGGGVDCLLADLDPVGEQLDAVGLDPGRTEHRDPHPERVAHLGGEVARLKLAVDLDAREQPQAYQRLARAEGLAGLAEVGRRGVARDRASLIR